MIQVIFWVFVVLVLYTYFFYAGILLIFSKLFPEKKKANGTRSLPKVSVIIAAYNEEKMIAQKIKNCLALDYPKDKLEIVIGSDGSTDNTNKIVKKYARNGIKLLKWDSRRGKISILNDLIPRSNGELLVFSDVNTTYQSDAIKKLVRNFEDPDVGCVCGKLEFKNLEENEVGSLEGFYWRYEQFLKEIEGSRGALLGANGGIYAIRKNLFNQLPSDVIVEDFIIPMKILEKGYKVTYEPEAVACEETTKRIVQERERRTRIGAGDFQALSLTWRLLNPLRGFSAFAYLSHKVIRWFVPFLLIGIFLVNLTLLNKGLYFFVFATQFIFYGTAIVGWLLCKLNKHPGMLGLPYYFVSMNAALFLGFVRFCTNSQSVTWRRTER